MYTMFGQGRGIGCILPQNGQASDGLSREVLNPNRRTATSETTETRRPTPGKHQKAASEGPELQ